MVRITELAQRTGVSPRRLRHYEAHGLLSPERDARGWRDYVEQDVLDVGAIDRLVGAGIPVELATRILQTSGPRPRGDVDVELLHDVAGYYRQLDARTQCLQRNRDALAAWLADQGVTVPTLEVCPTSAAPPT